MEVGLFIPRYVDAFFPVIALTQRKSGATLAEMAEATGWLRTPPGRR